MVRNTKTETREGVEGVGPAEIHVILCESVVHHGTSLSELADFVVDRPPREGGPRQARPALEEDPPGAKRTPGTATRYTANRSVSLKLTKIEVLRNSKFGYFG